MSREWVDDLKPPPRAGRPDRRDKRWVMRCDCWHPDHGMDGAVLLRCGTEGDPSPTQPPLRQYREAGWFIGKTSGDKCPDCLAAGHLPHPDAEPWGGGE